MRPSPPLHWLGFAGLLALAACNSDEKAQQPVAPRIAKAEAPLGATGVPIDPSMKAVVVVNPSSGPAAPQERVAVIRAQQSDSEARIGELMQSYAKSMDDPRSKERATVQMKKEMERHKRQTLEMIKLGQLPAAAQQR